jgi:hypothetical protein
LTPTYTLRSPKCLLVTVTSNVNAYAFDIRDRPTIITAIVIKDKYI